MADTFEFDPGTLTIAEAELLENLTVSEQDPQGIPYGKTIRDIYMGGLSTVQLKALIVVVNRRANPNYTLDDIDQDVEIKQAVDGH